MIQCRLRELIAAKARSERRKITYADIRAATGVNTNTLVRLANDRADRVAIDTIDRLCGYFECEPGDLFIRAIATSQ
jgi:putative transcriptional regulator